MEFHEVANLFPMMTPDEFAGLKEDIDRNGQIDPVWIYDGKIIDGRNRYLACTELGIEPLTREWNGDGDLVDFVVSMNVIRRHLSAGQKAFIALGVEDYYAEQAKARQKLSKGRGKKGVEIMPHLNKKARDQAGAVLGVSGRYVSIAKRIRNNAPELQPLVQGNDLSMKLADRLAAYNHPPYRQAVLQVHDLWKDSDKSLAQIEYLLNLVFHWYNPGHFSDQWFIHHFSAPQHWFWVNPFSLMELLNCEGPQGKGNPKCRVCDPEYRKRLSEVEKGIPAPACMSDSPPYIFPEIEIGPWGRKPDWNVKIHWLTAYHKIKDRGFEGVEFEEPGELVKSRQQWEKAGRRVKRGEKGIRLVFKHVGPGESYEPTMNPFTGFVRYEAQGFHVSQTDKAA